LETVSIRLYEGLFLVDSDSAASDWDGVNSNIRRILERSGAEIVSMKKWDERRLAYEIQGKSRGTYILTYFNVAGDKIAAIERNVRLSEQIMRVLIVRALAAPSAQADEVEEVDPKREKEHLGGFPFCEPEQNGARTPVGDAEKTLAEPAPVPEAGPADDNQSRKETEDGKL